VEISSISTFNFYLATTNFTIRSIAQNYYVQQN
jgi:hypothetical protein